MSKFTEFAEELKDIMRRAEGAHIAVPVETVVYMVALLEKAEKCRKKAKRYKRMFLAAQHNVLKVDPVTTLNPKDAEITDAYPADWKTVLYCDIEHNCAVSKAQLFDEYKAMVDTGTIDSDETFSDYLANCTSKNGTLVRLQ